jgi:DNA-binding transcriptional ArsR family regulator
VNSQPRDLSLDGESGQLYRHLLRSGTRTLEEHAAELGWPLRRAQRFYRELERLQLVGRAPDGTVRVDDPRATVGRLLDGEEAELDARRLQLLGLRRALDSFEFDYRRGLQLSGPRLPPFEQVAPAQAPSVVDHLFRTSHGDVLQVTCRVEVGPGHDEGVRRQFEEVAASGRVIRTIFPLSMLEDPHWHAFAEHRAAAGERQRYLPDDAIRVEYGVWGRTGVLLDEGGGVDDDFLLLRPAPVVDVFVALFEELWRRAEPVLSRDASARDVKLLELLALGFKDEALARQLGLSLRTVRRRIAALMDEHGVDTRFQLGMAVSSRGLLGRDRR